MKVKEYVYKIESNPLFYELDKLLRTTKEEFYNKRLDHNIYLYPNYKKQLYQYKVDNISKQLQSYNKQIIFNVGCFEETK